MRRTPGMVAVVTACVLAWAPAAAAAAAPAPTPTPTTSPPPGRFVEVNPSTVEAGFIIGIRASCPDNTRSAQVESRAFGEVAVHPQYGFLTAAATVRSDIDAQSYRVILDCPDTLLGASTTLVVVVGNRPSRGPATGFGGMAGKNDGTTLLTGGAIALVAGLALAVVTLRRRRPA
jgi:hypothetical protein